MVVFVSVKKENGEKGLGEGEDEYSKLKLFTLFSLYTVQVIALFLTSIIVISLFNSQRRNEEVE